MTGNNIEANLAGIEYSAWKRSYDLYIGHADRTGTTRSFVSYVEMTQVTDGHGCEVLSRPCPIELDRSAAQNLMDDLWHAGLRPSGQRQDSQVVEAKEMHIASLAIHIDDLRRIAERLLDHRDLT